MRYRLRDIPAMLATPLGRMQLMDSPVQFIGPVLWRMARVYRGTVAKKIRLVAVVGSLGKTTTTRCVQVALGGDVHKLSLYTSGNALAHILLRFRPWDRHGVIEVGISGPGVMSGFAGLIRPDITVVTSIGSEHHNSFGTFEVTRAEKSEMVRVLPEAGIAVLNGDDPNVRWMAEKTRARVITFGLGETNDVRASDVSLDWPRGTRFRLHAGGTTRDVRVRLLGRHMVYPVLAAVAVARAEGRSFDSILPELERLPPTPGRLETVRLPNGAILLRDDYKSTLETIDSALDLFSEVPAKRRIVVLGDVSEPPGSQGPLYKRLGLRVAEVASRAVFLCHKKQVRRYSVGAVQGGLGGDSIVRVHGSVLEAVGALRSDLGEGDVVLIKGRDTQRLGRIALALAGRTVRCDMDFCNTILTNCSQCPMLERGWNGRRFVRNHVEWA